MPGSMIGNYVIQRLLGQGGMGAVYLAEHALLGRPAAIKLLLPSVSAEEEIVQRFFDEARATTQINDPGIVQVFDFGYHDDGSAYIVMEYLEGETLDLRLEREGPLLAVPALRIARQVALSLHAAHVRGIVHRDLKLENVLMVPDPAVPGGERAKVLDFGIAKLSRDDGRRSRTLTGSILGTPIYMSPEQCRGANDVDGRADLYALGCLLFCLVTGRPPFDYPSNGEIIAAHLKEPAPLASSRQAGLSPELDQLLARCLAKDPDDRFASMVELAGAITELLADADRNLTAPGFAQSSARWRGGTVYTATLAGVAPATRPLLITSPDAPTLHARRQRRAAVVSSLAAAVAVLAVAGGALWRGDRRGPAAAPAASASPAAPAATPGRDEPARRAAAPPMADRPASPERVTAPTETAMPIGPARHDRAPSAPKRRAAPAPLAEPVPAAPGRAATRPRADVRPRAKASSRTVAGAPPPVRIAAPRAPAPRARDVLVDVARDAAPAEPALRVRDLDRGD